MAVNDWFTTVYIYFFTFLLLQSNGLLVAANRNIQKAATDNNM